MRGISHQRAKQWIWGAIATIALNFCWQNPTTPALAQPVRSHPLPASLAQWVDRTNQGDYFDQVQPTAIGYLVWSTFPISVYVQPVQECPQGWVEAVHQAVQEWMLYMPLSVVDFSGADVVIECRTPPLQVNGDLLRARSAETRYEIYSQPIENQVVLRHRFIIQLRPDLTANYTQAAARHELGHALGIWGHSPLETDALYFSQVRQSPLISVRDVNTLKRVYEQPTQLGWGIEPSQRK